MLFVTDLNGIQHEITAPTDMGLNVMEAIRLNEIPIKANPEIKNIPLAGMIVFGSI